MTKIVFEPVRKAVDVVSRVNVYDSRGSGMAFRNARIAAGFTMTEVAAKAGWGTSYQSGLEVGRFNWSDSVCEKLVSALKELMGGTAKARTRKQSRVASEKRLRFLSRLQKR